MKQNGFTLVELLAVIVILVVIFLLVFPAVEHIISESKETISNSQINTILDASYDYTLKNTTLLPAKGTTTYITLAELKTAGLVETDITDPETKELYPNDLVISIKNVGSGYNYSNTNSKLKGDYLYTVNISDIEPTSDNKPIITLEGLTKNSEGNYVSEINLNSDYQDVTYTAVSSDGVDLTSNVFMSITFNDNSVNFVDTSKLGIYKIYYTVVDENGNSNTVVRNVIINDNEPPILTIPEGTTIDTSITEIDLLEGVTCTDNSGVCNIATTQTIDYGVAGKYTITYTAQDSSGNTSTSKRVITIE